MWARIEVCSCVLTLCCNASKAATAACQQPQGWLQRTNKPSRHLQNDMPQGRAAMRWLARRVPPTQPLGASHARQISPTAKQPRLTRLRTHLCASNDDRAIPVLTGVKLRKDAGGAPKKQHTAPFARLKKATATSNQMPNYHWLHSINALLLCRVSDECSSCRDEQPQQKTVEKEL